MTGIQFVTDDKGQRIAIPVTLPALTTDDTEETIKGKIKDYNEAIEKYRSSFDSDLRQGRSIQASADRADEAARRANEKNAKNYARQYRDKYEDSYNMGQNLIDITRDAEQGNVAAGGLTALETALDVSVSNGVHRINSLEVQAVPSAQSLVRKIEGALDKQRDKGPIPPETLADIRNLANMVRDNAYDKAVRQITNVYADNDQDAAKAINQLERPYFVVNGNHVHSGDTVAIKGQKITVGRIHPDGTFDRE